VFGNLGNIADLVRSAGRVRELIEQATESLGKVHVEGVAGGGAVTAKVNGRLEVLAIRIDLKLIRDGDLEMLEDFVASAVNQALAKAREAGAKTMQEATGMGNLPGLDAMLGGPEDRQS
jgi:nucleoid-associated protein EbfC